MSMQFPSSQPDAYQDQSPVPFERSTDPLALPTTDDEDLAGQSTARVLITAAGEESVEILARRIHDASVRTRLPFVRTRARDFPIEPRALREHCVSLLAAAGGGSVLITDVEQLPPTIQDVLVDLLTELQHADSPSIGIRLMSGTTVSLLDRLAAGTFSERLFCRLNVIHLMA